MFRSLMVTALAALSSTALAQPAAPAPQAAAVQATFPAKAPTLIVAISVDQFSANLFAEYRTIFDGGFKRLEQGAVFPSGYQTHAATETCPGHSTILTGSHPSRTGIIANSWVDQSAKRADKMVYCAEDETLPGSDSSNYTASNVHLLVPTLGERMKAANPATRVVSVAGKDRAAIMMGGHKVDQLWYWDARYKDYIAPAGQKADPVVAQVRAAVAAAIARPRDAMPLPAPCVPKAIPVKIGDFTVGDGRFGRKAGDYNAFRYSPEFDAATLTLAEALIESMKLGKGPAPDIISIGLSATDYVGHAYGTEGSEMCLQLTTLDSDLGAFFDRLDATGVDYVVVLTADHGGLDVPERNREHAMPDAVRVEPRLLPANMGKAIGEKLGVAGPVLLGDGPFGDMYVDKAITGDQRKRVLDAAIAAYRADPQVAAVFTADEIAAGKSPAGHPELWTLLDRARGSFKVGRSGDFVVMLKPLVTPIATPRIGGTATHGSVWDYDRRVPIAFWRKGMTGFEQPGPIETVDIMPTLAALIGLPVPANEIDGRCLDLDAGPGSTCPAQ